MRVLDDLDVRRDDEPVLDEIASARDGALDRLGRVDDRDDLRSINGR
jgi:hypothetical protein